MLNDTGVSNPPDSNQIDNVQKNLYSHSDSGPFFVFVEKKAIIRYYLDSDGKEVPFNDESTLVQMINAGEIVTNQPMHPMLFGKILFEKLHHFKHTVLRITIVNKQLCYSPQNKNFKISIYMTWVTKLIFHCL